MFCFVVVSFISSTYSFLFRSLIRSRWGGGGRSERRCGWRGGARGASRDDPRRRRQHGEWRKRCDCGADEPDGIKQRAAPKAPETTARELSFRGPRKSAPARRVVAPGREPARRRARRGTRRVQKWSGAPQQPARAVRRVLRVVAPHCARLARVSDCDVHGPVVQGGARQDGRLK